MLPVTVVIPTLNEEFQIEDALRPLTWADEVIVVDGGSADGTRTLADQHGATVLQLRDATIGAQRNAGIEAARNEWVLALDADERASPELVEELRETIAAPASDAYRIRFRNFFQGRELRRGHWGRDWHVRLFRRSYRYSGARVHERLLQPARVGALDGTIHHRPYRDLSHYMQKMTVYARGGAEDLLARGRRARLSDLLLRPPWRFVREYVVYRGFLDGRPGLIMAALSATSTFLKYAFLYELERAATPPT